MITLTVKNKESPRIQSVPYRDGDNKREYLLVSVTVASAEAAEEYFTTAILHNCRSMAIIKSRLAFIWFNHGFRLLQRQHTV